VIVRRLADLAGTDREVDTPSWTSFRLLLAGDGMGFSMHETVVRPGSAIEMCYRNHLEAVYCVEGEGRVRDVVTGVVHELRPGTLYALNEHDEHVLEAESRLRLVCVFNPPVTGREVHDATGAYPASNSRR